MARTVQIPRSRRASALAQTLDGPGLQAYVFEAALSGDGEEMVEHRAANAQAADMLSGMHRLQLRVLIIEPLERADRGQLPAAADTEER